jgi:two-component sensor histidine kinase
MHRVGRIVSIIPESDMTIGSAAPRLGFAALMLELANGLQATGTYLYTARQDMVDGHSWSTPIFDKAAEQLVRAQQSFAELRNQLEDEQFRRTRSPTGRTIPGPECDLTNECPVDKLRQSPVREDNLLREKDEFIQQQDMVHKESDHRLVNGLQLVVSILSLQSRASANAEVASQLAAAANRVAMIESIHRGLHRSDGANTVAFKQCIRRLCHDFSAMLFAKDCPEQTIDFEGIDIELPTAIAIPLGFIASELITNAAKHGNGPITGSLNAQSEKGYTLSVANNGPDLPDAFNPHACKGLGMKIIGSYLKRIGGKLQFGPGDRNQGARFTVLF